MIFEQIRCGGDRNFGYLFCGENSDSAVVVDPSSNPRTLSECAAKRGISIRYLINTHSHTDHTQGNSFLQQECGAQVIGHEHIRGVDIGVSDGQELNLGALKCSVLHTPGHTPDSICVRIEDELLTGDTLFVGKIGGTGSQRDAEIEFESLKKLMALDDRVRVWPGHDYGAAPSSTIGQEKKTNPFIQRLNSFDDFLWLKDNWAAYKAEHGLV